MENNSKKLVGRFAPSPSGRMHLGNIFAALMSYISAKKVGGQWIVRIEDLDKERCRPEYADDILRDLEWLGLLWDSAVVRQSERDDLYLASFNMLKEKSLLYPCFCTRADLLSSSAPHAADGIRIYPGTCRNLKTFEIGELQKNRRPAWRIRVSGTDEFTDGHYGRQRANLASDVGDFIVRRADGNFAYQLAVCVDDSAQGVSQVVRARDLLSSAHQQRFLYQNLGLSAPQFSHIPLILSPDGRRLSKRDKDCSMAFLRERFSAEEIIGKLMFLSGFLKENRPVTISDSLSLFSWEKLVKEDIVLQ